MDVYAAKINRSRLMAASENERSLFVCIAHLANEVNALRKVALWAYYFPHNSAEDSGQVFLTAMFLKLLAGKLHEGQKLLKSKFYGTRISRDYLLHLTEEGKDALRNIKKYFESCNIISEIRNRFAFHYSPDEVDAVFSGVDEELVLYIEKDGRANNLYYFAEVLANSAMLMYCSGWNERLDGL